MTANRPEPDQIIPLLEQVLKQHPAGLSEYELLNQLATQLPFFSSASNDSDGHTESSADMRLFQRHFLLQHCLYKLEQQCQSDRTGRLNISALEIRLSPYNPPCLPETSVQNQVTVETADEAEATHRIREYYLDINNLHNTSQAELDEMLGKFWAALARHDLRDEALHLLDLSDPVDDATIRQRYREKVMQHHPDRGGDSDIAQQLNAAISNLLPKSR